MAYHDTGSACPESSRKLPGTGFKHGSGRPVCAAAPPGPVVRFTTTHEGEDHAYTQFGSGMEG